DRAEHARRGPLDRPATTSLAGGLLRREPAAADRDDHRRRVVGRSRSNDRCNARLLVRRGATAGVCGARPMTAHPLYTAAGGPRRVTILEVPAVAELSA